MKLLFYISTITNGGAERVVSNLINEMFNRGYECILVNTYHKPDGYKISHGIKRYYLAGDKRKNIIVRNTLELIKLRKICKKECADINISFMGEPNLRLVIATRGLRQKTVVSVRNVPEKEYKGRIIFKIANVIFSQSDGIVFQTVDAQRSFEKKVQEKGKIILNPVNKLFYDFQSECSFTERKGIVAVGRLVPQKNYPLLLCAYAKISQKVKDNLIIYGRGPEEQKLRNVAKQLGIDDRVNFAGVSSQLWKDISNVKLFVMTSEYEGMPNALMEALALGIPVVSADCPCGGPQMILGNDSMYGVLVKSRETNDFVKAMEDLLLDEKMWNLYHQKALERATMFFSKDIFDEWENYFQSII